MAARRRGSYVPERGDLVWTDLDPQAGHEQSGRRPAVKLTPSSYNGKVGLGIVARPQVVRGFPAQQGPNQARVTQAQEPVPPQPPPVGGARVKPEGARDAGVGRVAGLGVCGSGAAGGFAAGGG